MPTTNEYPLIGATVSRYRIVSGLGCGNMGVIYRAESMESGRPVALKFLPEKFLDNRKAQRRFQREARASAQLDHPNICRFLELGHYRARPFLVMELLEGQNLKERLRGGPLEPDLVADIGLQAAAGLGAAHEKGILHRDIKPANIFLTTQGVVKILDFGLAKFTNRADLTRSLAQGGCELSLTGEDEVIGTIRYMSPEQVRSEPLDPRADLFALGTVLYELATGRKAFQGETVLATVEAILHQPPNPIRDYQTEVTPVLETVILKLLAKEPRHRPQSALELMTALCAIRGVAPPATPPAGGGGAVRPRPGWLARLARWWRRGSWPE